MIADIFFLQNTYSWETLMVIAVLAFSSGLLLKKTMIAKQRKRILYLEDEMLSNHARILSLEKKLSEVKTVAQQFVIPAHNNGLEAKIS